MASPFDVPQSACSTLPLVSTSTTGEDEVSRDGTHHVLEIPIIPSLLPPAELKSNTLASRLLLKDFQAQSLRGFRHTVYNIFQEHRWPLWLVCATVALLSARQLLIERNLHYPLQLYINQLLAAATITICLFCWRRPAQAASEQQRRTSSTIMAHFLLAITQCFVALSMIFTMQAILHFTNLPVLVMMTVSFLPAWISPSS